VDIQSPMRIETRAGDGGHNPETAGPLPRPAICRVRDVDETISLQVQSPTQFGVGKDAVILGPKGPHLPPSPEGTQQILANSGHGA
jgi:hypothetical protein